MDKKEELEKFKQESLVEVGEDTTKYGEFVSSYFAWVSLPMQKERVEVENMTKNKEKDRKN